MAQENSFDIVSKVEIQEVRNAIDQALKEIRQRFDFKGSISDISKEGENLDFVSDDEFKLRNVVDIFNNKLVKRMISPKFFDFGVVEPALGGAVKQTAKIKQGIPQDKAKEITLMIRNSKLKVQAQIQADQIRVSSKSKDDLQLVMQMLKKASLPIELQFTNYR